MITDNNWQLQERNLLWRSVWNCPVNNWKSKPEWPCSQDPGKPWSKEQLTHCQLLFRTTHTQKRSPFTFCTFATCSSRGPLQLTAGLSITSIKFRLIFWMETVLWGPKKDNEVVFQINCNNLLDYVKQSPLWSRTHIHNTSQPYFASPKGQPLHDFH